MSPDPYCGSPPLPCKKTKQNNKANLRSIVVQFLQWDNWQKVLKTVIRFEGTRIYFKRDYLKEQGLFAQLRRQLRRGWRCSECRRTAGDCRGGNESTTFGWRQPKLCVSWESSAILNWDWSQLQRMQLVYGQFYLKGGMGREEEMGGQPNS